MRQNNRLAGDRCYLTGPVIDKLMAAAEVHARCADLNHAAKGGASP